MSNEIIVMVGLPGSGKSSYMKEHFEDTHIRINLDMLKTRNKENQFIVACLHMKHSMVIDNTNITIEERKKYIDYAKQYNVPIKAVYIARDVKTCISQNKTRSKSVPDIVIYTKNKKLKIPTINEGFDEVIVVPEITPALGGKRKILCLDFDGVIHSYTSGWKGADKIPDGPVPGAFTFIDKALEHFDVHIYSSRSGAKGGIQAMKDWFDSNNFDSQRLLFPTTKPPATIGLDDRVLNFNGVWPSMVELKKFKPWNKK
jgi:predicted kinase